MIRSCLQTWNKTGFPHSLRADSGTYFIAREFRTFCTDRNINLEIGSAKHHNSLFMVESAINQVRKLIDKAKESKTNFQELLLGANCMRSPITGLSSFEIFHRRSPFSGQSSWSGSQDPQRLSKGLAIRDSTLTQRRERSCKLRKAETFQPGDQVLIQLTDKAPWSSGNKIIKKIRDNSYLVELSQGNSLIRNERFLKHDLSHSGKLKKLENSNSDIPDSDISDIGDLVTPTISTSGTEQTLQLGNSLVPSYSQTAGGTRSTVKTTSTENEGKK